MSLLRPDEWCCPQAVCAPGGGSYLTGLTAALAHGFPVRTRPRDVEMSRRPYSSCTRPGVVLRRPWGVAPIAIDVSQDASEQRGAPGMTRVMQVQPLVEVGLDVAAHHGVPEGLVVADAVRRRGVSAQRR